MSRSLTSRAARFGFALTLGLGMAMSGFAAARAETASPADGTQHFVTCLGLLFGNGPQHAQECGPSTVPPNDPLAPTSGGGPDCTIKPAMLEGLPDALRVASLGDGSEFLGTRPSGLAPVLMAKPDPCYHCPYGLLTTSGPTVWVASLEDFSGMLPQVRPTGSMVSTC